MTTTVSWPTRLPAPTFDGYAIEPQESTSRTDMEAGPARQRRRFTGTPTRIPVRWRFSPLEFATFEAWFRYKAESGAAWFAVDLLNGVGMAAHEARFLGQDSTPYRAVPSRGGAWLVTSVLEIRDRPTLDEGALDILLSEDLGALLTAIDALHATLHVGLPGPNAW